MLQWILLTYYYQYKRIADANVSSEKNEKKAEKASDWISCPKSSYQQI